MNRSIKIAVVFALLLSEGWVFADPPAEPEITPVQQARLDDVQKLNDQIVTLYGQGKFREAIPFAKQALTICREILGEKHQNTVASLDNLGTLLYAMGDYAAARPFFEQALAVRKETLGEKHLGTAQSLSNLGALLEAIGDYTTARTYCQQTLAIHKEVLGERHPDTAQSLNNLGAVLGRIGEYAAARRYHEQALAIRKDVLGEKHPATAQSLNNLGALLELMGDNAAARTCHEQALAIRTEVLGEKHPDTALSHNNLGVLLIKMGDNVAARPRIESAVAIRKEVLGEKHPDTAQSLNNLGALLTRMGEYAAARRHLEQALAIYEVLGERHPGTAQSLNNLGFLLETMGDYVAARPYYERALAIRKRVLGEKHRDTALSLSNLGFLLGEMKDYAAARPYHEQALAIRTEVLGEKHADTAASLTNLGFLCQAMGDYAAAQVYYEHALGIFKEVLGEKHPDTALSLNNLGFLLSAKGDYVAAQPYYEQALANRIEVLGEKHPDTAVSLNNLGALLSKMGDLVAARPYYEHALEIHKGVLGERHPSTATSLDNLATLLAALGQWPAAATNEDEARRDIRRHVARVLPGLSEKEQLAFLQRNDRVPFYGSLSLGYARNQDPQFKQLSAGWLANGKAVTQEALAARALLARESRDPKLAETASELLHVRRQLAALAMAASKPGQEEARREELANLESQDDLLSRQLAQAGGQAAGADPWIELTEIREGIPPTAIFIDIARFNPCNFQAKGNEQKWQPARYVAWIIPPRGDREVQIVDLGEADKIDRAVAATRAVLRDPAIATPSRGLDLKSPATEAEQTPGNAPRRLAELVLQPILAQVGDAKQLIISPDAALWLIPWGALPLADGSYAIEQFAIRYVISGRDLVIRQAGQTTSEPLVMADPDYDLSPAATVAATQSVLRARPPAGDVAQRAVSTNRSTIGRVERLPGTAAEAKAISPAIARYAEGAPTVYLDRFALEGVFKAVVRPRVLVLGTHGFFLADQEVTPDEHAGFLAANDHRAAVLTVNGKPWENPLLRCGLLLAGCNQRGQAPASGGDLATSDATVAGGADEHDDGILTGMEVVGTDLRGTKLVVLSACETGLGQVHNGEGVAGLRQAFQLAGAEAVIASLWQVSDRHTADLMTSFFAHLADGQTKADALRAAQREMIESLRKKSGAAHPYFWAAFTLTGQ